MWHYCGSSFSQFAGKIAKEDRSKRRGRSRTFYVDDSSDDSDGEPGSRNSSPIKTSTGRGGSSSEESLRRRNQLKAATKESRHNVISRKDNLILSPDRAPAIQEEAESAPGTVQKEWSTRAMAGEKVSAATLNREFELEDILDYIKTGIASVIEDEVTQRFVAEELKVSGGDPEGEKRG